MRVILGIGGGIAAYKAAELARALMERGMTVQAVMTRAAQEFVRPLTFAALTGKKVITELFDSDGAVEHVRLTADAELLLVLDRDALSGPSTPGVETQPAYEWLLANRLED